MAIVVVTNETCSFPLILCVVIHALRGISSCNVHESRHWRVVLLLAKKLFDFEP